jgi:hypothetical protein
MLASPIRCRIGRAIRNSEPLSFQSTAENRARRPFFFLRKLVGQTAGQYIDREGEKKITKVTPQQTPTQRSRLQENRNNNIHRKTIST